MTAVEVDAREEQGRLRCLAGLDASPIATVTTGPCSLERRSLGQIDFPDGRVFACDPLVPMDQDAFLRKVGTQSYEVFLVLAVPEHPTYRGSPTAPCPVAAMLDLRGAPPVRWSPAIRSADEPSGAYGVDAGTGCLMGSVAAAELFRGNESTGDTIVEHLRGSLGGRVEVPDAGPLAFFTTGGDGVFESWWGDDLEGNPSMLLTELGEVQNPETIAARLAAYRRPWWKFWG